MRVVAETNRPDCKITVFSWNSKYLIKFEQAFLEQTYKISEMDISDDGAIKELLVDASFIDGVLNRFKEMRADLLKATERIS